ANASTPVEAQLCACASRARHWLFVLRGGMFLLSRIATSQVCGVSLTAGLDIYKALGPTPSSVRCVPAFRRGSPPAFGFRRYLGINLLLFPFGTKLIMGFLAMLTKPVADHP